MTSRDIPTLLAILFCRLAILGPFLWAFGAGRIRPAVAKVSNLMGGMGDDGKRIAFNHLDEMFPWPFMVLKRIAP